MSLAFRQRIFAWLVVVSVVPAAIAILVALLAPTVEAPVGGARAWEQAGASWQAARRAVERGPLAPEARGALDRHEAELSNSLRRARQAQAIRAAFNGIVAAAAIALTVLVGGGAIHLAGHLSRQLSRPIDELVDWTRLLQRGESLPSAAPARGAPEFDVLRRAFRAAEVELARSRRRAVEAAELRAFRDLARQVAHEIKNPLTPIRFAVARLAAELPPDKQELVAILDAESARLERMARDFGDLGRLPEGPTAPVDLRELLEGLAKSGPGHVAVRLDVAGDTPHVPGHFEPLRRAFANLVLNAFDAARTAPQPEVVVTARRSELHGTAAVEVAVRDNGTGIAPEHLARVFDPYFTTKTGGTGLGLAIVRQTIDHHGGAIRAANNDGAGATFTVLLPAGDA